VTAGKDEPRRFLIDPTMFGVHAGAGWQPEADISERVERVAAYIQPRAVCTIRTMYMVRPVEPLARALTKAGYRTQVNEVYMRRQFSGEYRVPFDELITWALALNNPNLLPRAGSITELLPPEGETEDW